MLEKVGLADFADRRVGGFSLGMRQRLGLAYTLLGDPGVLVLDEPINGLDPEGIKWIRGFLQEIGPRGAHGPGQLHLLSEVQQSVDDVIIIAKGALVHRGPLSSLDSHDAALVVVDSPDRDALEVALAAAEVQFSAGRSGLLASSSDPARIGHIAFSAGVEISVLHRQKSGLEESFLALVNGADTP